MGVMVGALASLIAAMGSSPPITMAQDDPDSQASAANSIAPPADLKAADVPNDAGTALKLYWSLSPDDTAEKKPRVVRGYEVYRLQADAKGREKIGQVAYGVDEFTDGKCQPGVAYLYEVVAVGAGDARSAAVQTAEPMPAVAQWFDWGKAWFGVILLAVCGAVVLFTEIARGGRDLHVREIAGLKAIEEAVGRATEMGRPCLFVPGLQDMNEIPTVAGISVLSHVARIAADYDATIEVPTSRSLVMTAARETVQAAYLAVGRPEAYNEDRIYYVTEEQFPYVAYLTGFMVREKPAACFYAGTFFAESLILAETGNSIGAIQIAGTAEASQLPFFVAACDYTLIGEELFAASAYLSGEPHQLGSLKGQDAGKLMAAVLLTIGSLVATAAAVFPQSPALAMTLHFFKEVLLGKGGVG
jgi:hypothetical protein